ncbi:MAG: DUF2779 domain-containing protein [Clostridia bacterium]|nr:DUF2779 domain-containing protein [Clostridia bacterium]
MFFSKSKYCGLWQCPKIAWLQKYKPEERVIDSSVVSRMESGQKVGDLAKNIFGKYVDVTSYTDGKLDLNEMIERTREYMNVGEVNICEASFNFNGLYCAVDILRKEGDGYSVYEVKSSTHNNAVYMADIAYQKYVLTHCGIKIIKTYLVNVNNKYVLNGDLDINGLFEITDVFDLVEKELYYIEDNLNNAELLLKNDEEPKIDISVRCNTPYVCSFWKYCARHIPTPSVFDLYRLDFDKKIEYYKKGMISYEDVEGTKACDNPTRARQVDFYLHDKGNYVDKNGIKDFLGTLTYPLYFLDFETIQPVIPVFQGTRPFQQITFQYSLHYIEKESGELHHKEFLAESGEDPRRRLAERLIEDIPTDVCILAYNKNFECSRIKELAETFSDLSKDLKKIERNIKDLIVPFRKGYYYNKAMGGSFSIKSVLPAMFPNDPSLDYHNLEEVHNGGEAMDIFPKIKDMPAEEAAQARKNLLKYCELDTYAMVKIWQELVRVTAI